MHLHGTKPWTPAATAYSAVRAFEQPYLAAAIRALPRQSGTSILESVANWISSSQSALIRTYRDLNKAPGHRPHTRSPEADVQAYLNHAVPEGTTNREISHPVDTGR